MSGSQLPAISSRPHSLSEAASSFVCHIPQLLHLLRDLESEEAKLDAQARQLVEQLPTTKDRPSIPIVSTPVSKLRMQATENAVVRDTPSTPHLDPSIHLFLDFLNKTLSVLQETSRRL